MKKRQHRRRCQNCGRANEDRLDNCYYCSQPLAVRSAGKWWEKIKNFFNDFGRK